MVALLGIIAVVVVHRTARRLFKHELTAAIAGLLMAIDGMAIVHSRTALLDQTLMFCMLMGFAAVVVDRDFVKAKLAGASAATRIGFRPWLIVAAFFLGLSIATKWSGLWFVVGSGLLVVFFTARTRMSQGHDRPVLRAFVFDSLPWLPVIIVILFGVYIASWSGWLLTDGGWDRTWAQTHPGEGVQWLPEALRSLLAYHQAAWNFHVSLSSAHSYSANPWTWPLQLRPTSFFYESYETGKNGCTSGPCSAEVLALGNPLIWWAGALALLHQAWNALVHRSTVAMAIVVMFLVSWAPWLLFQTRTVFSFYSIVMLPFVVLALARSLGQILGESHPGGRTRFNRSLMVGGFMVAVVALSIFFLPLWTGETISYTYWQLHMWLTTWI
jgi:dolichyl-phosphate-mannose--protein O-mannosyl transferase